MSKLKVVVLILGLAHFCPAFSYIQAQNAPSAPVPSQILTAKKVFISNSSGDFNDSYLTGKADRTYNEFYDAIKRSGQFEIVSTPNEADLVL